MTNYFEKGRDYCGTISGIDSHKEIYIITTIDISGIIIMEK